LNGQRTVFDGSNSKVYPLPAGDSGNGSLRFFVRVKDALSPDTIKIFLSDDELYHVLEICDDENNKRKI
jgi:hypothetical protein